MANDILSSFNPNRTPQTSQADPRQRKNAAGGYTFQIDDLARVRRFLILGTEGGTYYTSAPELTRANAKIVFDVAATRTTDLVGILHELSIAGRVPKQNPILFALAAVYSVGDAAGKKEAERVFNEIVRIGTHLAIFLRYARQFGVGGRAFRRTVATWYTSKTVDALAYQAVKYRQREGWTHRDALRISHPISNKEITRDNAEGSIAARAALYDWICGRPAEGLPQIVAAYQAAQTMTQERAFVSLIEQSEANLPWEVLPDVALTFPKVWEALIERGLPQTALMRQLPRLTRLGVLKPMSPMLHAVCMQLADPVRLKKGRVHPISVLVAAQTYTRGASERGTSTWDPIPQIAGALNDAFYNAYRAVEVTNKRYLLALDVSGSMGSEVSGLPLTCRDASAAIALVTANVEPNHHIVGFTGMNGRRAGYGFGAGRHVAQDAELTPLNIGPHQRLDDAVREVGRLPFGATDCALPMQYALKQGLEVDVFCVYTDNETWYGLQHPHEALADYRRQTGIDAKLVVLSMTATGDSIADPNDPSMLDIAGFDSAVPALISEFAVGSSITG